jgi:hypothetical protein
MVNHTSCYGGAITTLLAICTPGGEKKQPEFILDFRFWILD